MSAATLRQRWYFLYQRQTKFLIRNYFIQYVFVFWPHSHGLIINAQFTADVQFKWSSGIFIKHLILSNFGFMVYSVLIKMIIGRMAKIIILLFLNCHCPQLRMKKMDEMCHIVDLYLGFYHAVHSSVHIFQIIK